MKEQIKVAYRIDKEKDARTSVFSPNPQRTDVVAVFPDFQERGLVAIYAHIGQHGYANPDYLKEWSNDAIQGEYADLHAELQGIYDAVDLVIVDLEYALG